MRYPVLPLLLGLLVICTGCDEEVAASVESSRAFSLYGVLNPEADTQWVRVFAIRDRLQPIESGSLDARLVSTDAQTGTTRTWRDSLLRFEGDTYRHAFWAPFQVDYGRTYQLEVRRPGTGEASRVAVDVPPQTELVLQEPLSRPGVAGTLQPVLAEGDVPRLFNTTVTYDIRFGNNQRDFATVSLPYQDRTRETDDGWLVQVDLSDDYDTLRTYLERRNLFDESCGIQLLGITLDTRIVNDAWQVPEGATDPSMLVQPGVFSNVENGFGFVGAGYRKQIEWYPGSDVIDRTAFVPLASPFPSSCL